MSKVSEGRALMLGQLVAGLAGAQRMIQIAQQSRGCGLLSEDDERRLGQALDTIAGIEQRAWLAKEGK